MDEIEALGSNSRVHIQKLVYSNMVDRFDAMVDRCILANCREEPFVEVALKGAEEDNLSEAEIIRLLLKGENLQEALTDRLRDGLRNTVLRQRHSRKLEELLKGVAPGRDKDWKRPRVNPSTGQIVDNFKPQRKSIPHSIPGYADWLYSRRNAIVHGTNTSRFLDNDRAQIKKLWNCDLSKSFKISLSSITVAMTFYQGVAEILKETTA